LLSDSPSYVVDADMITDALTGAFAREQLDQDLPDLLAAAEAANQTCSLIVFDLDHFKSINDAFGHQAGDAALQSVASVVRSATREQDRLYRYGGDEFVLILPDTNARAACELAERLLQKVSALAFVGQQGLAVTLSAGVAAFPQDAADSRGLFARADARNYDAKRRGRARVVGADAQVSATQLFADQTRLIERDAAVASANAFLAELRGSASGTLVIEGEPGAGCSRLLRRVATDAALHGFLVIPVSGSARLRTSSRGVLSDAMRRVAQQGAAPKVDLVEFGSSPMTLEHIVSLLHDAVASRGSVDAVHHASVRDAATSHSPPRGVLFCVDNMHHVDWGSLRLMQQLLQTCRSLCIGIAYVVPDRLTPDRLNERHESVDGQATHSNTARHPLQADQSTVLRCEPLSDAGLHVWLRTLMQWEPPAALLDWLTRMTGNLPAYVERALAHLIQANLLTLDSGKWSLKPEFVHVRPPLLRRAQSTAPHNLPIVLTSFISRDEELAEIHPALTQNRIVTLLGPGGTGKTRLAIRAATDLLGAYPQGIWWVDLATLNDVTQLPRTVAEAISLRGATVSATVSLIVEFLKDKNALIIFDNCEHVIEQVAATVESIAAGCPEIKILTTSREALNCRGEHCVKVPTLQTPKASEVADVESLAQFAACRLFIERAVAGNSAFEVGGSEVAAVVEICQRLDGIPLAIELAAARTRSLRPSQIASRLDDVFRLLTGGARTALPRQQTLYALIEWSHALLREDEQMLFRRLAVFGSGATLESIEETCECEVLVRDDIFAALSKLIDKSLVIMDASTDTGTLLPRYRMLTTIGQFAREKLVQANEASRVRDRHLEVFLRQAEMTEAATGGREQLQTLDALEREIDNFRIALTWARERAGGREGTREAGANDDAWFLRLASALWRFWDLRGHLSEGLEWLRVAIARAEHEVTQVGGVSTAAMKAHLPMAIARYAYLIRNFEGYAHASQLSKHAVVLARERGDDAALAIARFIEGAAGVDGAEPDRLDASVAALQEAKQLFLNANQLGFAGTAQVFVGIAAEQRNDMAAAHVAMEAAVPLVRESGDVRRVSHALVRIGLVALAEGKDDEARNRFEEVLHLADAARDVAYISNCKYLLGRTALYHDDFVAARDWLTARELTGEDTRPAERAWALIELARVEWANARHAQCAAHTARALQISRQAGLPEITGYALHMQAELARAQLQLAGTKSAPGSVFDPVFGPVLGLLREAGNSFLKSRPAAVALVLESAAHLAHQAGDSVRAATFLGAREACRANGYVLDHYPFMLRAREALVAEIKNALGDPLEPCLARGKSIDAASALAQLG
jgi:diguanylate cyclase (GGDEF)-like protein